MEHTDESPEVRNDHIRVVAPVEPIQEVFDTYASGGQRFTCRKCGSVIHMATDVGHVCSWLDRVMRCPYCSFNNKIYPDGYRK